MEPKKIELEVWPIEKAISVTGNDMEGRVIRFTYQEIRNNKLQDDAVWSGSLRAVNHLQSLVDYFTIHHSNKIIKDFCLM